MKKHEIIILAVFIAIATIVLLYGRKIYNFGEKIFYNNFAEDEYLYGSGTGEHGTISLKVKLDDTGSIKEVYVTEHPDNDVSIVALQKLIKNSLDKDNVNEIDAISSATETTTIYKDIVSKMLNKNPVDSENEFNEKVLLTDPEIKANIERPITNPDGFKSGLGGYVLNSFTDADYNKNGNLITNEYICAVLLNQYNRIEDVKFDHIVSNISFDKNGRVPTGGARAYTFPSDKAKTGFNGLINDGNYIDIFDFEKKVLTLRHFEDVKNRFINKKGYEPLVYALENAIDNARFTGAGPGDLLGLSTYKVLKKKDILDATDDNNGKVCFTSNYCLISSDKEQKISSCMFDNVENQVSLTSIGKILGSREKEIYTLNELSNTDKYTKIDLEFYLLKLQFNVLADFIRGNTIDNVLALINDLTDDKGFAKPGSSFEGLDRIDFIEFISLISKAFVDSIKIRAN